MSYILQEVYQKKKLKPASSMKTCMVKLKKKPNKVLSQLTKASCN